MMNLFTPFFRDICCDFNLYVMLPSLPSLNASKTSEYSLTPSTLFLIDILHHKIPTNWNYIIGITSFTTVLVTANNIYEVLILCHYMTLHKLSHSAYLTPTKPMLKFPTNLK